MDHDFELRLGTEQLRISIEDEIENARAAWHSDDHDHAAYELHILLCGMCRVDVNGKEYPIGDHQAILIAPGQFHRAMPSGGPYERFSMTFSLGDGPLLRSLQAAVPCCKVYPVTVEMENLCRSIFCERVSGSPFRRITLQNLLSLLLIRNFCLLDAAGISGGGDVSASPRKYTELIDGFFETRLSGTVTVETLAEELHLSKAQVNRVLKKHYGMTFREKLLRARMARAVWLLRHTDKKLDEVAGEVGYGSASAFHEVFRKQFHMPPEKYRRQYKGR